MRISYDNKPARGRACIRRGCGLRARWDRTVNGGSWTPLCDKHFAVSLREDAHLTHLRLTAEVTVTASVDE